MSFDQQEDDPRAAMRSPTRADFYAYEERRREDPRNWVAIDKTTAMIVGAIASAALAVAIAGGTALVEKVDETAKDVERGRAERIQAYGEVSKNISIVETKMNQLIAQITQLELRIERSVNHDLELRDKKIESIERELNELKQRMHEIVYRRPAR
jgi:hypothetical protein